MRRRPEPSFFLPHSEFSIISFPCLLAILIAIFSLILLSSASSYCSSTKECLNGGTCDSSSRGRCRCPRPASALQPSFFVGERCEMKAMMCADTTTFFCANGAECVEVVQGERYECHGCPLGFSGPNCDMPGVQCRSSGPGPSGAGGSSGELWCFNGGSCSNNGASCICPHEWSGNDNCTLSHLAGYNPSGGQSYSSNEEELWYVPLLGGFGAVVMLIIIGGWVFVYLHNSSPIIPNANNEEETVGLQEDPEGDHEASHLEDSDENGQL